MRACLLIVACLALCVASVSATASSGSLSGSATAYNSTTCTAATSDGAISGSVTVTAAGQTDSCNSLVLGATTVYYNYICVPAGATGTGSASSFSLQVFSDSACTKTIGGGGGANDGTTCSIVTGVTGWTGTIGSGSCAQSGAAQLTVSSLLLIALAYVAVKLQ